MDCVRNKLTEVIKNIEESLIIKWKRKRINIEFIFFYKKENRILRENLVSPRLRQKKILYRNIINYVQDFVNFYRNVIRNELLSL